MTIRTSGDPKPEASSGDVFPSSDDSKPEASEVERDNEVQRILSCFKLNAFEYLNLPFDSSLEDVKKQYRKLSLLVHPDKCKHPQAKEAFGGALDAYMLKPMNTPDDLLLKNFLAEVPSQRPAPSEIYTYEVPWLVYTMECLYTANHKPPPCHRKPPP